MKKKNIKLTNRQYQEFKGYVEHYKELFGLTEFQLHVVFDEIDTEAYATCDTCGTWITITLNKIVTPTAINGLDLQKTALHEVLHVVFDDFLYRYFKHNIYIISY